MTSFYESTQWLRIIESHVSRHQFIREHHFFNFDLLEEKLLFCVNNEKIDHKFTYNLLTNSKKIDIKLPS